jgi:hypothetical protein
MKKLREYIAEGFGSQVIERQMLIKGIGCHILEGNGPYKQVQSFSTFGIASYELKNFKGQKIDFGIEVISAVHPIEPPVFEYPGVLAAIAYKFTQDHVMWVGNVVIDVVKNMCPSMKDKPHFYLIFPPGPNYWKHNFDDLLIGNKTIKFICGFPISDQEYKLIKLKGQEYFEDYLEENEIDIFYSKRPGEIID